ncbi:carbon-nitrogen hydrolase [Xylariaceae sp. AK1471]|nr:carbon-nitrogen hydrolase [Xylariaceae sp. AK1471]
MAKAAIGQICSSNSMAHNLAQCVKLVGQAANAGAKILFLPEASDYIGTSPQESLSLARPVASSPFVTGLQAAAAKHSVAVHVGIHVPVTVKPIDSTNTNKTPLPRKASNPVVTSIPQSSEEGVPNTNPDTDSNNTAPSSSTTTKLYNRTIYITQTGTILPTGSYNKLHLFDYATLRESASTQAGSCLIPPIPSPIGRLGSLICFDMRFPEPALHLTRPPHSSSPHNDKTTGYKPIEEGTGEAEGESKTETAPAQILLYPSAFTVPTGRAHWDVLLRARAIETQSYVIAAAQVGAHNITATKKPRVSYGHSLVIDPWGKVVLEMKGVRPDWDGESVDEAAEEGAIGELGVVDIDLVEWERVREKMPLIRRTDVYPEI